MTNYGRESLHKQRHHLSLVRLLGHMSIKTVIRMDKGLFVTIRKYLNTPGGQPIVSCANDRFGRISPVFLVFVEELHPIDPDLVGEGY